MACGSHALSTGDVADAPGMKRPAFDDPGAFRRRWSHLSPAQLRAESLRDPLLFAADHISIYDRRVGSVALCILLQRGPSAIACIPDGPPDPADTDCLVLIGNAVMRMGEEVRAMGVVHHRVGGTHVTDLDRRWALALKAASMALDFEPIGVLARLHSGALVRVPIPTVLPAEYMGDLTE